ncbi:hypothetical protein [Nitrosomonas aestuarii]|nr:hypothetical protein [Nitrosomonas aestuarii]
MNLEMLDAAFTNRFVTGRARRANNVGRPWRICYVVMKHTLITRDWLAI